MTAIGLSLVGAGAFAFFCIRRIESDMWGFVVTMAAIAALATGAMLLSFEVRYTPIQAAVSAPAYVPISGSAVNTRIAQAFADELFNPEASE